MDWLDVAMDHLTNRPICGYYPASPAATEPTALAALALVGAHRTDAADSALDWLAKLQSPSGSVGMSAAQDTPCWPTSLAALAWLARDAQRPESPRFTQSLDLAVRWSLAQRGETLEHSPFTGHNTRLVGWPWVEGTHSWLEPTALHTLALKASGQGRQPRVREAVRLLLDRQLPTGGCNYGNTSVLGQMLRPHVQPTGIALLALAGESACTSLNRSLEYLREAIPTATTATSLAWAVLGLTAHHQVVAADELLARAAARTLRHDNSPHRLALLVLAAQAGHAPLVTLVRNGFTT